jgi:hypothetical protein
MTKHTGRCLCGQVSFEVTAEPLFAGYCHCLDCQKSSGAGHTCATAFPAAAVVVKGKTATFASEAHSGATMTRHFCPKCGSRLFAVSSRMPEVFAITASAFDDSSFFKPMATMFATRRQAWDHLAEGIPVFDFMPPGP